MEITKARKIQAYLNSFFWLGATYLLSPVFYFLIFLRKRKKVLKPKILIMQIGKIGDVVCTTPLFREIKKKFPSAHLDVIIIPRSKDVLKNNPRIDETILITDYPGLAGKFRLIKKLRKEKYDWALSLDIAGAFLAVLSFWSLIPNRINITYKQAGEIMGLLSIFSNYRLEYKRHTPVLKHRLSLLKFMGIEGCSEKKEIFIQPAEEKKASMFLKAQNLKTDDLLIGISVTAGIEIKQWELTRFAKLADQLAERLRAKIIFIGSSDDRVAIEKTRGMMKNKSINASGCFKLHELPAFLKKLKLFISVDSGPLYMADAMGVPVVDIAGPIDTGELYPLNASSKIIQKKIYCVPCTHMFSALPFCKEGHLRCLKEITPEEVFNAALDLIK